MPKYCSAKDKVRVSYKFGSSGWKTWTSKKGPITISVGYDYTAVDRWWTFNFDGTIEGATYSFTCVAPSGTPSNAEIWLLGIDLDDWGGVGSFSTGYALGTGYGSGKGEKPIKVGDGLSVSGVVVNEKKPWCHATVHLEWRSPQTTGCRISITSPNQGTFEDKGSCPCIYKVTCGDECPPGQTKVDQPGYPGYCCMDCKALAAQLQTISNQIGVR